MAVNLVNSNDIEISQEGENILLNTTMIEDSYSTSATDGYSCNFLNGTIIEESGTGYIRFGDGTQICYGSTNPSVFPNNNVCTGETDFAKAFTTVPNVIVSLSGGLSNASNELTINVKVSAITTSNFSFAEHSSSGAFGTAERRLTVQYIAIGRWK